MSARVENAANNENGGSGKERSREGKNRSLRRSGNEKKTYRSNKANELTLEDMGREM
jgi:hypothetical protein